MFFVEGVKESCRVVWWYPRGELVGGGRDDDVDAH